MYMRKSIICFGSLPLLLVLLFLPQRAVFSQTNSVINEIIKEGTENSQLTKLAHELIDQIGPRLVGTPQMQQANDWAVNRYAG